MPLRRIAIVQARRVLADEAIIAPTAAVMRFNTDPVTHRKFIYGRTKVYDRPSPLMPRREGAKRQGEREVPVVDFEVSATGPTHGHLHQHLPRAGLRHGALEHADVLWAKEYSRTHCLRNGALCRTSR